LIFWAYQSSSLLSVLALAAVFLLGFIVPGAGFSFSHYAFAYIAANAAIALICLFALIFFHDVPPPGINAYRIAGLIISVVSIALAHLRTRPELAMSLFAILQLALWIVLVMYIRKRLHLAADTTYKAEKQKAAELKKSGEIKA
jgi:membrane-bound ClpP family serine protease